MAIILLEAVKVGGLHYEWLALLDDAKRNADGSPDPAWIRREQWQVLDLRRQTDLFATEAEYIAMQQRLFLLLCDNDPRVKTPGPRTPIPGILVVR